MAPTVKKGVFGGGNDIGRDDIVDLQVNNKTDDVTYVLTAHKWNGTTPVGCIILELSANNESVEAGSFGVRGCVSKDIRLKASALWSTAKQNVTLSIRAPSGADFSFDGGLCSEYLPSEEITHAFSVAEEGEEPTTVSAADRKAAGVGPFCMRLVCYTVKATLKAGVQLKYSLLVFPGSREDILDVSELAQSASWPGLEVADGELSLIPTPSSAWQCPVLPLLLTGTPWDDHITMPPANELRHAIAAIMARSAPPDGCKTRVTLLNKWERFASNPDEFSPKKNPFVWPVPDEPNRTPGINKKNFFLLLIKS